MRLKGCDNAIAFGSEMKVITPLMDDLRANRKLVTDPERIVFYESTGECVIEGIERFPAGSYAYADDKGMTITRWWNSLDNLVCVPKNYEEQVEEFRTLFLDSCKLRMRSDVTIGTALSGGLDSSATICAMAHLSKNDSDVRMNKDWQHAFVASFPGTTMDETAYAKKVTDYLGIDSTFVTIDPVKAIDKLDDYIYLFEDVIRIKGYVNGKEGTLYFNYVLNEFNVYYGEKRDSSLIVVIGTKLGSDSCVIDG